MSLLARAAVVAGMIGVGVAGAWLARARLLPDAPVADGVRIDGVPCGADADTLAVERAAALLGRRVVLRVEDEAREVTLADLGVRVDAAAAAGRARRVGKDGDLLERRQALERAKAGAIDVPLLPTVDREALSRVLLPIKEARDAPPVSARLDVEHGAVLAERDGRYVDVDGAELAVLRAARSPDAAEVVVPVAVVAPRVDAAFVKSLDVHAVMGQFETWFSRGGDQAKRGQNIDVAASKIDGTVLAPRELVSFNAIVGDRSEDSGFQKSWEIYKGEMVEGVGGGTCQVASTVHAAAFFGGLEVLERLPHSRPSAYITMGLDATVVYPSVDLKLRNPYDFPVVLHAKVDGSKLTVQLLGPRKPARVVFAREVLETKAYERKVEEDPKLGGAKVLVKQHGLRGYTIERVRTIHYADGTQKIERTKDTYPPTMEIYAVPVGFDVSRLPPLPAQTDDGAADPATAPAAATAPAPPATAPAAAASTDPSLQLVDGPGAHAPTDAQTRPQKTLTLSR